MKTLALAALVTLLVTSSAHALPWELSWTSEWTGLVFTEDPPGISFESSFARGRSAAAITPRTDGLLMTFDTAAGRAQLGVDRTVPGMFPDTRLPFNVPEGAGSPEHGGLFLLQSEPQFFFGSYTWSGEFADPDTFEVRASFPGSGPSPLLMFHGSGVRSAVAAPEPEVLAILLAALGALVARRRSRRYPTGRGDRIRM